ncbi:MAG: ATP-binding protein [Nocardioides sp.]
MPDITEVPSWPTKLRGRLSDGRLMGTDNSVWMYRVVPMSPVVHAKSPADGLEVAGPLMSAYTGLAGMASSVGGRRQMSRGSYRETHLLLVNIPKLFTPAPDNPLADHLRANYQVATDRRLLLFGVKLVAKVGGTGGMRAAVDSVVETIVAGTTPLSDYDADSEHVAAVLDAAGLMQPTQEQIRLANAWWNHGSYPDTPLLNHAEHLHIFGDATSVQLASDAGTDACDTWTPVTVPHQHAISFASVQDIDLGFMDPTSPSAHWVSTLLKAGALVVSIRGQVEPGSVTRSELRRQRKRHMDDINERVSNGKMERAEQQEMVATLQSVEELYATGGAPPPTLAGASAVVALSGRVGDIDRVLPDGSVVKLSLMAFRQRGALAETMLCSPVRDNPNTHDLPIQTVACSGIPSLNAIGDQDGALIGFTELDRQPAFVSPTAASTADAAPLMVIPGQTGAGKLVRLSTPIPTPTGYATMGTLRVGDEVIGRDGKPCRVVNLWPVNETPELYRITLSDGQMVFADYDHQWLVSSWRDRNYTRAPKRLKAVAVWGRAQEQVAELLALAEQASGDMTLDELTEYVLTAVPDLRWRNALSVRAALKAVDAPFTEVSTTRPRQFAKNEIRKTDPVLLYPAATALETLIAVWQGTKGGNATRWGAWQKVKTAAVERALADGIPTDQMNTIPELSRLIFGQDSNKTTVSGIRKSLASARIEPTPAYREVVMPLGTGYSQKCNVLVFDVAVAIKCLAVRLAEQHHIKPVSAAPESRMTTGEMLAAGIRCPGSQANFAIRAAQPVELPEADLLVSPYVLGAWLGDGGSGSGTFTQSDAPEHSGDSDMQRLIAAIQDGGYQAHRIPSSHNTVGTHGLQADLRAIGVLGEKHIPTAYLRSSVDQRLALLQGLMDTDGTIGKRGGCELSLSDRRLASDALDLIRSLGIKASATWDRPASYRDVDGQLVTCKDRHRIKFTTDKPVFRLPRKAERLPATLRETATWLYITAIEPVKPSDPDYEPGRCITVDSPDRTYLCEQYVPTSNTVLMLSMAHQFALVERPVVIFDPKASSDLSAVVALSGGQVYSLDSLLSADGVFDPIRFSRQPEVGVELAASVLLSINPWGTRKDDMEVPLQHALSHGVSKGATCIGQALRIASRDLALPEGLIERFESMLASSPQFRAIAGLDPHGESLSAAKGITLIKVGSANLDLPEPGAPAASIQQRIALALVRMIVFGSGTAVAGRGGVVMLDEAWVVLGAGRAEVERLGRLGRSMGVLVSLFTQRVTDALNAGLAGYISRGLILPMEDPSEAAAACELFKLEPTPERMRRLTAKATQGGVGGVAPNWDSMRALRDPDTGEVIRGAVAIYSDLSGRAVPVEVTLPSDFLKTASTNPEDVRVREEASLLARVEPGPVTGS